MWSEICLMFVCDRMNLIDNFTYVQYMCTYVDGPLPSISVKTPFSRGKQVSKVDTMHMYDTNARVVIKLQKRANAACLFKKKYF